MEINVDLVVFDIVGTTVEDGGQVANAFLDTLREGAISATGDEIAAWRGAPKRRTLRFFLERELGHESPDIEEQLDRMHTSFQERLEQQYRCGGVRAIPGAESTIRWLRDHGVASALTTGFSRRLANIVLTAVGWGPETKTVSICSDEVPKGRPAPYMIFRAMELTEVTDVRRVIKIGDTVLDLQAGTNAGVRGVVGVLSGSHGMATLGLSAHTHTISSVAELPDLLESQFAR